MNSPYASPNSPIASSKRARVNSAAKAGKFSLLNEKENNKLF